ncbi:signal recognition particle subunit [Pleurotus ostreatus]|uniref:Signal recognition particle subunit n=1 Tax=Pleurotus ostreatus TaxID=5322 RepID=A0A8H6ZVQ1_PLEOS|nr:signal recognition particle subunit [Pleurotus ostreatus]KAF7430463.1 signal recognition particle subunit [Pleurotus ostreatus]KAJ8701634.1 signal recognition particle subunit [Pleurotus ostreatus]
MSRRTQIIEEFDDDTDLPLPSQPLPNTGTSGPLLQEIDISDDEIEYASRPGPASPSRPQRGESSETPESKNTVTDITPYKAWTCIYPIYLDAKRPYTTGERRVKREKALWWPLSKDIAEAANRLGLGTLHEVNKSHPRDWENPGRVRVLWKKDGRLMNPIVKTKKVLLEMISMQIQHLKPENIPKSPYVYSPAAATAPANLTSTAPSSKKGKQPLLSKSKSPSVPLQPQKDSEPKRRRLLPIPPEPLLPLATRVSPYSPALSTGVLIEAVKAGMNAQEGLPGAAPGTPSLPGGAQKGKRKVVRVRG